ncbi:MAG TPA: hypothetical protein VHT96_00295 [Clostridia bacterium]|nr:hypothetical protein [Clostridia bacterium]
MHCKYSFVCDAANISQTGNLNVLGIFRNISAAKFPCQHPRFTYVANIEFHRSEVGKHSFRMNFIDDDGKEIISPLSGEIDVSASNRSANIIIELANIQFPKAGVYEIDLTLDNQHVTTESINVLQTD